jgi:hypothetical protein
MDPDSIRFVGDPAPYQLAALDMSKKRQEAILSGKTDWIQEDRVQVKVRFVPQITFS